MDSSSRRNYLTVEYQRSLQRSSNCSEHATALTATTQADCEDIRPQPFHSNQSEQEVDYDMYEDSYDNDEEEDEDEDRDIPNHTTKLTAECTSSNGSDAHSPGDSTKSKKLPMYGKYAN